MLAGAMDGGFCSRCLCAVAGGWDAKQLKLGPFEVTCDKGMQHFLHCPSCSQ